jgi:hypothetical protein
MRQPLYPLSYTGKQVDGFEPSFSALATRHPDHWTTPAWKPSGDIQRAPCAQTMSSGVEKNKNEQVLPARFALFAAINCVVTQTHRSKRCRNLTGGNIPRIG